MKKRLAALALILCALFLCLAPLHAEAADLYFVAVNDTVPLTLTTDVAPFYSGSALYAPRSVFQISGLGITPSYNDSGKTLTLFSRSRRIVFYLEENRTVDENGQELSLTAIQRSGTIYLPVSACASHFGIGVSYLTSGDGYRILRFTTGSQIYDDTLFLEKAANLIAFRVQQYQAEQTPQPKPPDNTTPEPSGPVTPQPPEEPDQEPPTVYLAVLGAEEMERNLSLVASRSLPAAFFLTEKEIRDHPDLVCAVRAAGYPVGLTAEPEEQEPMESLRRANEALDALIQEKTLLAMLPRTVKNAVNGYFTLDEDLAVSASGAVRRAGLNSLVLLRDDGASILNSLRTAEARFRQLRETSPFQ